MTEIRFILIAFILLPIYSIAQGEVKDSVSIDSIKVKETVKVQTVDELKKQISELSEKVKALTESENNLRGKIYDNEQVIKEQKDSISRLEHRLLFADTIVAYLSNDCLCKRYDPKNVADAISHFERMYSVSLKKRFSVLKTLLQNYDGYFHELEGIFVQAQNDKSLGNPFTGQKQALSYIEKIKSTKYYREVYNQNWTIPYLNSVVDKSIEAIKSFDPKKTKGLHLIELLK